MDIYSFAVIDTYLFTGIYLNGIWRRPLSDMNVNMPEKIVSPSLPMQFTLNQNYSISFNPTISISISLPAKIFVSLKVFNSVGREVATILSKELPSGTYTQQWKAIGLARGIYFCQLQAGLLSKAGKIILLR
jgi:hypothetical protein